MKNKKTNFHEKHRIYRRESQGGISNGKFAFHYIHQNFPFALQSRVNPHFHSPQVAVPTAKDDVHPKSEHNRYGDNSFEVLPLTLQSEIKQHQIISLIKGNC